MVGHGDALSFADIFAGAAVDAYIRVDIEMEQRPAAGQTQCTSHRTRCVADKPSAPPGRHSYHEERSGREKKGEGGAGDYLFASDQFRHRAGQMADNAAEH